MFYKKKGMPEVGEVVLCTVKKVLFHSVFVTLDEYSNLEGMLHISEVAPGRIRNIRDYVKEDKKIICKILQIDNVKKHIDLSLRRVNLSQKRNKNDEYKQEQKAEKLLESVANKLKMDLAGIYSKAGYKLIEEFGSLTNSFYAIIDDGFDISKELGIEPKIAKEIIEVVKDKIKPPEVTISGVIFLKCNASDGVDRIKSILKLMLKEGVEMSYIGAPRYSLKITAGDYKEAEQRLKELLDEGMKAAKKAECEMTFERVKD